MAANGISKGKRREVVTLWMKQLMNLHERQGTAKPAAAGWIGAVYALRAASRLDANREWGKLGDEIISHLEQAFLSVMGPDSSTAVDVGRKLLQTERVPNLGPMTVAASPMTPASARAATRAATSSGLIGRPTARAASRPASRGRTARRAR
jgi:hypothetical protein